MLALGRMLTLQENKAQKRIECEEVTFPLNLAFPSGILGFEEVKEYVLQPLPELDPFFWMEGVTGKKHAFLLVPPAHVIESYSIELNQEDVDSLDLQSSEDALIFNIVTYGPNQTMTVNLKGPILVNRHTMVAKQVVPINAVELPTTFPLNN